MVFAGGIDCIALYGALISRAVPNSDLVASRGALSSAVNRYTSGVWGGTIRRLLGHRFVLYAGRSQRCSFTSELWSILRGAVLIELQLLDPIPPLYFHISVSMRLLLSSHTKVQLPRELWLAGIPALVS